MSLKPLMLSAAARTAAQARTALAPLLLALLLLVCARVSSGQPVNVTNSRDWRSTASEHFSRGSSTHSSNWAIIASTSIFWYNYRHTANALAVYRAVKEMGLDDDHIILMLADDHACNARNVFQGQVFSETSHTNDLYGSDVAVDYRGRDATEQNLLRLLIGRHVDGTHRWEVGTELLAVGSCNALQVKDAAERQRQQRAALPVWPWR
jgi:glycosylphosphatidylinositol transamidase (GPIT) subunit GPI8